MTETDKNNLLYNKNDMKQRLSKSQSVCLMLLWIALCYIVVVNAASIDGPVVTTLVISAALVFIPALKAFKKEK